MTATCYYDRRGIPIHVGDLIRVKHYRHQLRREQMWQYFLVVLVDGLPFPVVRYVHEVAGYQCALGAFGNNSEVIEVLDHHETEYDDEGRIITFNERPRRRTET